MTTLNVYDYLQRIGVQNVVSRQPTLETLKLLHLYHIYHIPFENIDVFRPQGVVLESAHIADKLIYSNRGGYCFELNQLFSELLTQIGFSLTRHIGRVWRTAVFSGEAPSLSHQLTVVTLNGIRYLVDVGYGPSGLFQPLAMVEGAEQQWGNHHFWYRFHDEFGHLLEGLIEGERRVLYSFTDAPAYPADYRMANFFINHSPDQFLFNHLVCSLSMPTGRKVLFGGELKITEADDSQIQQIDSRQQLQTVLYEHFEIELPDDASLPAYT